MAENIEFRRILVIVYDYHYNMQIFFVLEIINPFFLKVLMTRNLLFEDHRILCAVIFEKRVAKSYLSVLIQGRGAKNSGTNIH